MENKKNEFPFQDKRAITMMRDELESRVYVCNLAYIANDRSRDDLFNVTCPKSIPNHCI